MASGQSVKPSNGPKCMSIRFPVRESMVARDGIGSDYIVRLVLEVSVK